MFTQDNEILISIIASTLLIVLLVIIIIIAVVKYQSTLKKQSFEMETMKNLFQQEILKAKLEMREQTLTNISQEIHDNIGQILSLVKLNLNKLIIQSKGHINAQLISTRELTSQAINDLRQISRSLNTSAIKNQSLTELLKTDIEAIQRTGFYKARLSINGTEKSIESQRLLIIYRICQEALNNVIKHSNSHNITVGIDYLDDNFSLNISDDGEGFDTNILTEPDRLNKGTGLFNMINRARLIDAKLNIVSRPGLGTQIGLRGKYM